jgi:hypothetical protein
VRRVRYALILIVVLAFVGGFPAYLVMGQMGSDTVTITVTAQPVYNLPTGGGGVAEATVVPTLTGLVAIPALEVDLNGIVQSTCQLKTSDGKLTLDIAKDTRLLDFSGKPLKFLSAALQPSPPAPPSDAAIILAYELGPNGATFSPPITLTIKYDPATLPEGVTEKDLYAAYWDGSKWLVLTSTVGTTAQGTTAQGTTAHTVSCNLSHFTTFAVISTTITPPAPAAFSVSNLLIQPAEVQPNDVVNITLSVANTGGTEGSYTVVLKINGVKEAEKSVTVAPGSSGSVAFSVTREEAGSYSVVVDGLSGSFTVVVPAGEGLPPEKPTNWTVLGGIIAAAVVVGLLILFLVRRRAA